MPYFQSRVSAQQEYDRTEQQRQGYCYRQMITSLHCFVVAFRMPTGHGMRGVLSGVTSGHASCISRTAARRPLPARRMRTGRRPGNRQDGIALIDHLLITSPGIQ